MAINGGDVMKFNLVYRIIIIVFLISTTIYSQLPSFEKTYQSLDNSLTGYQITEIADDNFIISGYTTAQSQILLQNIKVDRNGKVQWVKKYNSKNIYSAIPKPFLKISDIEYWMITSDTENNSMRVKLIITDSLGSVTDSIIYSGDNNEYGYSLIKNGDNVLLVAAKKINSISFNRLKLINVDNNGLKLWEKEYTLSSKNTVGFIIQKYGTDQFLIYGSDQLLIINKDGEIQNTISSVSPISSVKIDGTDIIIAASTYITKINNDGRTIWKKNTDGSNDVFYINNQHEIFLSTKTNTESYLKKLDADGNIIQENRARGIAYDLIETNSNEYYCTGKIESYLWFVKLDNNFEYKSVELTNPKGGEKLIFPSKPNFTIKWFVNGFDNIDIMYSVDDALTWQVIELNYPITGSTYNWVLPNVNSDKCFVKIQGSSDHDYFSINPKSFSITPIYTNSYNYIAGNEIFMWIGNNGSSCHDPIEDDSGLYWPGGMNANIPASFGDGILWGGIIGREIRVNGATYRYGLQPGPILPDGTADDPNKEENKLYKLKKDWQSLPEGIDKEIYQYNYDNWPAENGAPWIDVNGDGIFTRGVDKPEIIGEETLFYVANDLDTTISTFTYGGLPIGLEFQQTLYAYNTSELKDAVFKKIKLINKGSNTVNKMYLTYWSDDDLGYAGDDYVGCDTLLNLGYTYNGDNYDEDSYAEAPPAIGRVLLQGPVVASKYDTARVNGKEILNYKNLPLTSSFFYIGAHSTYSDPDLGIIAGSEQFYNNMKGLIWDGNPIIDPNTKQPTKFCLAGDPVNATGWYEGKGWPGGDLANDRRMIISTGPFDLAPGESQDIVFAIFLARGTDNINSISKLKEKAVDLHKFWGNKILTNINETETEIPEEYSLSQNYPNPFNPTTTIEYTIPGFESGIKNSEFVSLIIYDILGRKVATLVNSKQKPGKYILEWNASKYSSGIYFYKLSAGEYIQTRKMTLIK